jgi:hypothetical protein
MHCVMVEERRLIAYKSDTVAGPVYLYRPWPSSSIDPGTVIMVTLGCQAMGAWSKEEVLEGAVTVAH